MSLYRIQASIVHHTTDNDCVGIDVEHAVPSFIIDGAHHNINTVDEAAHIARTIICPVNFQYESITVKTRATQIDLC